MPRGTPTPLYITSAGLVLNANPSRKYLLIQNVNTDPGAMLFVGINLDVSNLANKAGIVLSADPNGPATWAGSTYERSAMNYVPEAQIFLGCPTGKTIMAVVIEN